MKYYTCLMVAISMLFAGCGTDSEKGEVLDKDVHVNYKFTRLIDEKPKGGLKKDEITARLDGKATYKGSDKVAIVVVMLECKNSEGRVFSQWQNFHKNVEPGKSWKFDLTCDGDIAESYEVSIGVQKSFKRQK